MARRLNMLFLATIALAALLQNSAAQRTYTVGDSSGWAVPSGGAVFYSTWAGNKNFRVGDTLVFNFASGRHNVAGVLKADFDACNTTNTQFVNSSAPANIVLNSTGEHYYICTVPGHCNGGQKLAINVSAATPSPAPQPSSPAPSPATPSPSPSATPAPPRTPTSPASAPSPGSSPSRPSPVSPPTASPPPSPTATPPPTSTPPTSSTTPPAPSTPPTSSTTPPAPPGSSATSLGVAGLSATLLSLFVAVFLC
ncbi:hypothetical protein SLA2020_013040 [Shorea laevis]